MRRRFRTNIAASSDVNAAKCRKPAKTTAERLAELFNDHLPIRYMQIKVFGKYMTVTYEEYVEHCQHLGL